MPIEIKDISDNQVFPSGYYKFGSNNTFFYYEGHIFGPFIYESFLKKEIINIEKICIFLVKNNKSLIKEIITKEKFKQDRPIINAIDIIQLIKDYKIDLTQDIVDVKN